MTAPTDLGLLLALVARLRAPDGCPWDREQGLSDVRSYLLEEAHEAAAAIDSGDWDELCGELGDLLFQVAFIGRLAEEAGAFALADAIVRVRDKMVDRHPHVFGGEELASAREVRQAWERRKAARPGAPALLSGVAPSLPALTAAYRMTQKAAGVGFDWPNVEEVLAKLDEEVGELRAAIGEAAAAAATSAAGDPGEGVPGAGREGIAEEIGDLLFTAVNLARKLEVDPESALARTNLKFRRRFGRVEEDVRSRGRSLGEATLEEMDALWEEAKAEERSGAG